MRDSRRLVLRVLAVTALFLLPTLRTAMAENRPPDAPQYPTPFDGKTNAYRGDTDLEWYCYDEDHDVLTFDVYLGDTPTPPLFKGNLTTRDISDYWVFPELEFSKQYWWKVVAFDSHGAKTVGPTWTFTVGANHAPVVTWDSPSPKDKSETTAEGNTLFWISYDQDNQGWGGTTDAVYLGTSEPLPLIASGIGPNVGKTFALDPLPVGKYYWRVKTSDGELESTGPTWSFTVISPGVIGDVNNDGSESIDDVDCAMLLFATAQSDACGGLLSPWRADVNCDQKVTPRDARCIHKHLLDGSCAFCDGSGPAASAPASAPIVTVDQAWLAYDMLHVRLAVSNVFAFGAYGFTFESDPPMTFVSATNLGAVGGVKGHWGTRIVGGYLLDSVMALSPVNFVEVVFQKQVFNFNWFKITNFVDDLEGAEIVMVDGDQVPVLFSSFRAVPVTGGVQVSWKLVSDEAMESFSLYRRDAVTSAARLIAAGPVNATSGSYLDTSARPGKTYHYELVIRTTGGDEFRSPLESATTRAITLALHQNVPNPFNPQTTIGYDVPGDGAVRVKLWILDVAGRVVSILVNGNQPAGTREIVWRGTDDRGAQVASGVYFSVLEVAGERVTRKLVLLK